MNKKIAGILLSSSMIFTMSTAQLNTVYATESNEGIQLQVLASIEGNFQNALNEIKVPKWAKDGTKIDQGVSDFIKENLDNTNISVQKDETKQLLIVDFQIKDVYLASNYVNGKSKPGISYYNMMNYFTKIKQVRSLLEDNDGYSVKDSKGNELDKDYIEELHGLLQQINDFDPNTNLEYDWDSRYNSDKFASETTRGGLDVIATSTAGNVKLSFHIDSHGWWGYDLVMDSIGGMVMGYTPEEVASKQNVLNEYVKDYTNFFVIKMKEDNRGTWYMLKDTDLENPMIYVSADKKEAFIIDVDFYGANNINRVIKSVIGDDCESIKIFCTHNHGDHIANLAVIGQDAELRNKTTIIWPENEPHGTLSEVDSSVPEMTGKDVISDIDWKEVKIVKDMEKFNAAGYEFQFIEIPNEHTPGGGQLADLTNKILYSGDTLGAQVHLGGTSISEDEAQAWIDGTNKTIKYIEDNGITYNIGGHTAYLNNTDFAKWVKTAVEYGVNSAPVGTTLIIVENGRVVNGTDRFNEMMENGLTDREELNICSINFTKKAHTKPETKPETKPDTNTDKKPSDQKKDDNKTSVKTGDDTNIIGLVSMMVLASGTICFVRRKVEE